MAETAQIPGVSLGRRLAVGGMGELHLAEREVAGGREPCVVKQLLPRAGELERALFAREAEALDALGRGGARRFVRLLGAGPEAARPEWLVLEWVDGVDLATLLEHRRRRGRPLSVGAGLALAQALAEALVELEAAVDVEGRPLGLVHRDVHPGNVLCGRDGSVKLTDLGVAAFLGRAATSADLKGTLAFMAPEQLRSGQVSAASDLYSAGLVAYEALVGAPARPPGVGGAGAGSAGSAGPAGIGDLLAARAALPVAPSAVRAGLGPEVDAALLAALAVDPAARPSARAWAELVRAAGQAAPAELAAAVKQAAEAAATVRGPATLARGAVAAPAVVARSESEARPLDAGAADRPARAGGESAVRRGGAWRLGLIAGLGAALGAGVVAWALSSGEPVAPRGGAVVSVAEVVGADASVGVDAGGDASVGVDAGGDAGVAVEVAPMVDVGASGATDTGSSAHTQRDGEGDASGGRVADTRPGGPTGDEVEVAERGKVVLVREVEGPLHVSADGVSQLAPFRSKALRRGDTLVLRLTGGAQPMKAVVRVERVARQLVATVGAPRGEVHTVRCGGAERATPAAGLVVGAGGISCRLEAADGRTMAFALAEERR